MVLARCNTHTFIHTHIHTHTRTHARACRARGAGLRLRRAGWALAACTTACASSVWASARCRPWRRARCSAACLAGECACSVCVRVRACLASECLAGVWRPQRAVCAVPCCACCTSSPCPCPCLAHPQHRRLAPPPSSLHYYLPLTHQTQPPRAQPAGQAGRVSTLPPLPCTYSSLNHNPLFPITPTRSPLAKQGAFQAVLARCRIELDGARLVVLHAAHELDAHGNKVCGCASYDSL